MSSVANQRTAFGKKIILFSFSCQEPRLFLINLAVPFFFQRVRLSEVKRQEQELLENQSIPLRNYLMKHVMPTLAQGLIECCKMRPDDPVDFVVSS